MFSFQLVYIQCYSPFRYTIAWHTLFSNETWNPTLWIAFLVAPHKPSGYVFSLSYLNGAHLTQLIDPTCFHSSTLKSLGWAAILFVVCLFYFQLRGVTVLLLIFLKEDFNVFFVWVLFCFVFTPGYLAQWLGGFIWISYTDLFWGKGGQEVMGNITHRFRPFIHAFILEAENIACCSGY